MRRNTTVPRTKEWKLQRRFNTGEDWGLRLKATPKGPPRTSHRDLEADQEGHPTSLGKTEELEEDLIVDPFRTLSAPTALLSPIGRLHDQLVFSIYQLTLYPS